MSNKSNESLEEGEISDVQPNQTHQNNSTSESNQSSESCLNRRQRSVEKQREQRVYTKDLIKDQKNNIICRKHVQNRCKERHCQYSHYLRHYPCKVKLALGQCNQQCQFSHHRDLKTLSKVEILQVIQDNYIYFYNVLKKNGSTRLGKQLINFLDLKYPKDNIQKRFVEQKEEVKLKSNAPNIQQQRQNFPQTIPSTNQPQPILNIYQPVIQQNIMARNNIFQQQYYPQLTQQDIKQVQNNQMFCMMNQQMLNTQYNQNFQQQQQYQQQQQHQQQIQSQIQQQQPQQQSSQNQENQQNKKLKEQVQVELKAFNIQQHSQIIKFIKSIIDIPIEQKREILYNKLQDYQDPRQQVAIHNIFNLFHTQEEQIQVQLYIDQNKQL